MTAAQLPAASGRNRSLDGARGAAIVLVVLSHGWLLWPMDGIDRLGPLRNLFQSGNLAVSIFFVIGGWLLVRSLYAELAGTGRVRPIEALVRRAVRLTAAVAVLVAAMSVTTLVDLTAPYHDYDTPRSAVRLLTYTFNWFVENASLQARPDMGHMWFISVYMQVTVVLLILFVLFARHRAVFAGVLAGLICLVIAWRFDQLGGGSLSAILLRTSIRMDGMLWGALAATVAPWVRVTSAAARVLVGAASAALVVLTLTIGNSDAYLRWPGQLINVAVVAFLVGLTATARKPVTGATGELVGGAARERAREPVGRSVGEPVGEPVDERAGEPVGEPVGERVGEPVGEPVGKPVHERAIERANEPANGLTGHIVDRPVDRFVDRILGWPPLVILGRCSLAIYIWHYPVFWAVSGHSHGWAWPTRTLLAFAITALAVVLTEHYVDHPIRDALSSWRRPTLGRRTAAAERPPISATISPTG